MNGSLRRVVEWNTFRGRGTPDPSPQGHKHCVDAKNRMSFTNRSEVLPEAKLPSSTLKKRRKPRWKRADRMAAASGRHFHVGSAEHQPPNHHSRPGKKRLRKLKYEQQQLSPVDRLLVGAERIRYTGSVWVERINEEEVGHSSSRSIHVVTSSLSMLDETDRNAAFVAKSSLSHQIRLQPLLVLDLNGILCHRIRPQPPTGAHPALYRPVLDHVANTPIIPRPDLASFLEFLDQHFCLALWTSAKRKTATALVRALVTPQIAQRLLFVWGQDRCRRDKKAGVHGPPITVFEKDLALVWKEYPLWNAENTLLMDDSPDKCLSWQDNAVHPPPLNGRATSRATTMLLSSSNGRKETVWCDYENSQRQVEFFQNLNTYWRDHPLLQEWDVEGNASFHNAARLLRQVDFLKEHATGHMGWTHRDS